MRAEDVTTVAVVKLLRTGDGKYAIQVDHCGHGDMEGDFVTVGGAFTRASQLVLDELRARPTEPELTPISFVP